MPSPGQILKKNSLKFIALLSIVRWYNILLLIIAQYLAAVFLMTDYHDFRQTLLNPTLHKIVLSTLFIVASGFIINNFYDHEKDSINRPQQTAFERLVRKRTKLNFYFFFNTIGTLLAATISWRATLFFVVYAFALWFYSHKLKRLPFVGNFTASGLAVAPFFGIFFYFTIQDLIVFPLVGIFWSLNFFREMIKDMIAVKGDTLSGYQTLPVISGIEKTKRIASTAIIPSVLFTLWIWPDAGSYLRIFLVVQFAVLALSAALLQGAKNQKTLILIHNLCKVMVVLGVFSIPFFSLYPF